MSIPCAPPDRRPDSLPWIAGFSCALVFPAGLRGAEAPVPLQSAAAYGVLAGSTVTSTGGTTVNGDLGLSPGTSVTGFPPGIVNGAININNGAASLAQADLTIAYNNAVARVGAVGVALEIGGTTIFPGLYSSASTLSISTGGLVLDALGDPNAVWIFQIGSTLITSSGWDLTLAGGADPANIFWQVGSSATIGSGTDFQGTIMAFTSITMVSGANLNGRALARNGAVTLDNNQITVPGVPEASTFLALPLVGVVGCFLILRRRYPLEVRAVV